MGDYLNVEAYLVVGGESVPDMIRRLNAGVHVVVSKHQLHLTLACTYLQIDRKEPETILNWYNLTPFFLPHMIAASVEELEYCIYILCWCFQ